MSALDAIAIWTLAAVALGLWLGPRLKANAAALCLCGDCGQHTQNPMDAELPMNALVGQP